MSMPAGEAARPRRGPLGTVVAALGPAAWRERVTVPVVRISGAIGSGAGRFGAQVTAAGLEPALKKAFGVREAPAVAVIVNSPGGAPVQAHLIYRRLRELASEKQKRLIVAVEDAAASGGYLIALAGDEIVVDPSSIVGSIGVVSAGFGFTGLIERIGVERRVHATGTAKGMLDPFRPEKKEDVARLKAIHEDIFAMFAGLVRERRGDRLADEPDLFSGAFWAGGRAVELGLADRVGSLRDVLRERYGKNVRLRPIATDRGRWARRFGIHAGSGHAIDGGRLAAEIGDALEERALWSRLGL